jgi:acetyltransferase EpsM
MTEVVLIGYARHALVVHDIFRSLGRPVVGYCEPSPSATAPAELAYLGPENGRKASSYLKRCDYFVCVGDNQRRRLIQQALSAVHGPPTNAVHSSAVVSPLAVLGHGVMVGPRAVVNALASLGDGVICNSSSVVEHECRLGDFTHLASGAVLAGGVVVGRESFLGAGCVVIPDLEIGDQVMVGAGSVVIRDLPSASRWAGNPCRRLDAV